MLTPTAWSNILGQLADQGMMLKLAGITFTLYMSVSKGDDFMKAKMISILTFLLIATFISSSAQVSLADSSGGNKAIIKTVGTGSTIDEARNDAIRQALQETMQQLIVVDRIIKDDQIIRDKIMSTMNGYIEDFKELSIEKEENNIKMMAEVTVSRSRIENFIAPGNANVGNVSGSGLFAESQREIVQRKVRGEIFDRLFRGFPSEVMEVKIDAIKPDVHDPSVFNLFVTVSYSKSWINALMSTLGTLQIAAYRKTPNVIPPAHTLFTIESSPGGIRDFTKSNYGDLWSDINPAVNYLLPPGTYFSFIQESLLKQKVDDEALPLHNCSLGSSAYCLSLGFAFDILDENGKSVKSIPKQWYMKRRGEGPGFYFDTSSPLGRTWNQSINIAPMKMKLKLPASAFNVAAAKKIVLFPFLTPAKPVYSKEVDLLVDHTNAEDSLIMSGGYPSPIRKLSDKKTSIYESMPVVIDMLSDQKISIKELYDGPMKRAVIRAGFSED